MSWFTTGEEESGGAVEHPSEEELARLRAKHRVLVELSATVNGREYYVIARLPTYKEFEQVEKHSADLNRFFALKGLLLSCVVFPFAGGVSATFEGAPGLVKLFGEELMKAAGADAVVTVRKLTR